jgi:hypothetical protein
VRRRSVDRAPPNENEFQNQSTREARVIVERRRPRGPADAPSEGKGEAASCEDFRCFCGSLLARVTPHGVQLKCRRCKRTMLVPIVGQTSSGRAPPDG